jgi:hypothetical protein
MRMAILSSAILLGLIVSNALDKAPSEHSILHQPDVPKYEGLETVLWSQS